MTCQAESGIGAGQAEFSLNGSILTLRRAVPTTRLWRCMDMKESHYHITDQRTCLGSLCLMCYSCQVGTIMTCHLQSS